MRNSYPSVTTWRETLFARCVIAMGRVINSTLALAVYLIYAFAVVEGKVSKEDSLSIQANQIEYLDKFVYGEDGHYEFNLKWISTPSEHDLVYFLLIDDDLWQKNWPPISSCAAFTQMAQDKDRGFHKIDLTDHDHEEVNVVNKIRDHFWYFVIANCGSRSVTVSYNLTMLNEPGSWTEHFSNDELGLPVMYLVFFILFVLGCLAHGAFFRTLQKHNPVRALILMMMTSYAFQLFSLTFYVAMYYQFAKDGVTRSGLEAAAFFFDVLSQLAFLCLTLLLAMGWAISRAMSWKDMPERKMLLAMMLMFFVLYLVAFAWHYTARDPSTSYYQYESNPGLILIIVRACIVWPWFLILLRTTFKHEGNGKKKRFYKQFGVVYSLYFLSLPLIVLLAYLVAPHLRAIVVASVYQIATAIGFFYIAFWFWPTRSMAMFGGQGAGELLDGNIGQISAYNTVIPDQDGRDEDEELL